tara:strand:- start:1337 stop:1489 length:153 start_codon:yes stop_codon:yes gene_type:complete
LGNVVVTKKKINNKNAMSAVLPALILGVFLVCFINKLFTKPRTNKMPSKA